jgi:hypothetical protein
VIISILIEIAEIDGLQASMLPNPQYNRWSSGAYNTLQVLHRTYTLLENFSTTFGEIALVKALFPNITDIP